MNAVLVQPGPAPEMAVVDQAPAGSAPKKDTPLTAGWNGEHFFIKSADGQFSISPYGYVDTDYRAYKGDGAPSDTFILRRARFGFQGNFGSHFNFALLTDAASTSGSIVRDVYLNVRIRPEFQFQAGQFKTPFAQESGTGATNLDFVERGFQALLYPSAASAYRSPGIAFHGDIDGGVLQYWVGAFNGKGYAQANTTNQPEVIGRLRFYPFRKSKDGWLKELAFGGSADRARSRGLSGDRSFSGNLPGGVYDFFPQFAINGPIQRYNGEFTYIKSAFALRGEFDQLNMSRNNVGSEQVGRAWLPESAVHHRQGLGPQCDLLAHGRKAAGKRHAAGKESDVRARHPRRQGPWVRSVGSWFPIHGHPGQRTGRELLELLHAGFCAHV